MKLNLLLLAIVAVVRAMIPLYCIITKREITATDPWWQINVAKAIREQGHRIPRVLPRMKSHKVLGYPALYSWFLSFIPKSYMMRVALFTGTVFDIILFWLVLYITQWLKLYERVQIDEQHFYILTTIIFITTPFFNRMSLGKLVPRARPLGVLLGNISIAFAMMYVASWNIWHLFFAVVVFSLNTATSRFGVQGTIALIIGLGLLFKELYLVLFPFYAIPISVILTLGGNWGFLKGHFYHSVLYWKKLYKDMSLEKKHELYFPKKLTKLEFIQSILSFQNNTLIQVFFGLPLILPIFYYFHAEFSIGMYRMLMWLLAGIIVMMITSVGKLKIFGQAERYLDYCIMPYTLLGVFALNRLLYVNPILSYLILGYTFIMFVGLNIMRVLMYSKKESHISDYRDAYEWLEKNKGPSVVLSVPLGLSRFGYFYTNHEFPVAMTIDEISPQEYNKIIKKYPLPAEDLTFIIQKYDVQYVVGLKGQLTHYFPLGPKIYENDVVDVFSIGESK